MASVTNTWQCPYCGEKYSKNLHSGGEHGVGGGYVASYASHDDETCKCGRTFNGHDILTGKYDCYAVDTGSGLVSLWFLVWLGFIWDPVGSAFNSSILWGITVLFAYIGLLFLVAYVLSGELYWSIRRWYFRRH